MSDLDEFISLIDETSVQTLLMSRDERQEEQRDDTVSLLVCSDQKVHTGLVIAAVGTVGGDIDSVEISLHGFIDGRRVRLDPIGFGDELIVALRNA